MNSKGKILVASPRYLFRAGVESVFSKMGFTIILDSKNQNELEKNIVNHNPDMVFIDSNDGCFKIEKTIAFLSITKPAKTILIADDLKRTPCELFLKVGVQGIINSSISESELIELFKYLERNEVYIVDKVKNLLLVDEALEFKNTCADLNISQREVEIIKLISEGFINKEIADKLFLSTHTVNTHRKNIMNKLGVNNASGIVLFAVKEKLISPKEFLFSSRH
jgi:DNA-binding NarL/FixJ family response regulator